MGLKVFSLILVFIIMIKCIESKKEKEKRSYVIIRDKLPDEHKLYGYSIFDSTEKKRLYRLKTSSSEIDILMLVDYPAKNIVANMEGVLLGEKLNVTFSVYDYQQNKWTDGTMVDSYHFLFDKYAIEWNSKQYIMKNRISSKNSRLYNKSQDQLLAKFVKRTQWLYWAPVKYDLKIYSNELPDAVCFFALAVIDHTIFHGS
jgi:hypothetical protein